MWPFINLINLNRYLIVWKVNRPLVRLPPYLPVELSLVLGSLIAERLPTQDARPWRKTMAKWEGYVRDAIEGKQKNVTVPEAGWPIEAILFAYPAKQIYGQDELILWELELVGGSADHSFFLEIILPAMEAASVTTDPRWHRPNRLWGRFDIQAIYAARGARWEPVAQEGKLDLSYHATPAQWADGLTFGAIADRTLDQLTWLTPFDLPAPPPPLPAAKSGKAQGTSKAAHAPTLQELLQALAVRLSLFIPGKRRNPTEVWNVLSAQDQAALHAAIEQAAGFSLRRHKIERAPKNWPGRWIGTQTFLFIPDPLVPYLELASILHLGKQTHFGCGTFTLA